jgi:hypothetical protein
MAKDFLFVAQEPRGPSQLVEIPVQLAGVNKVQMPDVQQLRSDLTQTIIIKGIRLIPPTVLSFGPISGFQTAPLTELVKISAVFYSEGWEKGQLIPILTMNDFFIEATGTPFRHFPTKFNNWQNFDWAKSFLSYSNGTVTVLPGGKPYVVMLDVEYERLDANQNPISGSY